VRSEISGYAVITAGTGEDGLRAAVDARPAVIVVDGVLPGIGWFDRDQANPSRRRASHHSLYSCWTRLEERTGELRALEAGADAYVRKEEHSRSFSLG